MVGERLTPSGEGLAMSSKETVSFDGVGLVVPTVDYEDSYREALREKGYEQRWSEKWEKDGKTFKDFVDGRIDRSRWTEPKDGKVPATEFWLIKKNEFIGYITIRHMLDPKNGHIGYEIRTSKRNKGYGKEILRLGLDKSSKLGLSEVVLSVDKGNDFSERIIKHNGGILDAERSYNNLIFYKIKI